MTTDSAIIPRKDLRPLIVTVEPEASLPRRVLHRLRVPLALAAGIAIGWSATGGGPAWPVIAIAAGVVAVVACVEDVRRRR